MKVKELTNYMESIAPLSLQEEYDNCGLVVGDLESEVTGVLITVDVTPDILQEAIAKNCNLVYSHHPVIFKGMKRITGDHVSERIVITAIKSGISLYASHTNLDNLPGGFNRSLIMKLGVLSPSVLEPVRGKLCKLVTFCPETHADKVRDALFAAGAGHIGNYDSCSYNGQGTGSFRALLGANPFVGERNKIHFEKEVRIETIIPGYLERKIIAVLLENHPYEEVAYDIYPLNNAWTGAGAGLIGDLELPEDAPTFLQKVKDVCGIPYVRHSKLVNNPVRKVALCGGSGGFLINAARRAGADIFLTGDIRYHDFFEARDEIIIADIGHYESEQFAKEWIFSKINEKFPNFAVLVSEVNSNPVNYL